MSKVIVFTNPDKIRDVHPDFASALEGHMPTEQNPVFHLLEDGDIIWETVNDFSSGGVYLVYDSLSDSTFDKLLEQCKGDEVLALVHSMPFRKNELKIIKGCSYREGLHDAGNIYYHPVLKALSDIEPRKEYRITEILKYSLKQIYSKQIDYFLLRILEGHKDYNDFKEAYATLRNNWEIRETIDDYYDNGCPTETFCDIRDYLQDWVKEL